VFRNSRLFVYIDYFRTTLFYCFLISLALFLRSRAMTVVSVTFSLNCAVETDLRPVYSDTTQLNSTELSSTVWTTVGSVCRSWRHKQKLTDLAVRCSTGSVEFSWVQSSWVELCRYEHPFTGEHTSTQPKRSEGFWCPGRVKNTFLVFFPPH